MMLEGLIGGEKISEEEIDKLRKSMFTNDDGLSFFMDSIANDSIMSEIRSDVVEFIDKYGKYQPEAFFNYFKDKINTSIIRNARDFQDLLECILPENYSKKKLLRLRPGSYLDNLVEEIEGLVEEKFGGTVQLHVLSNEIPGFTQDRIKNLIDRNSQRLFLMDESEDPMIGNVDSFDLPEDFSDTVNSIKSRLSDLDINYDSNIMNILLSLKYGYRFFEEHNLTCRSFEKISGLHSICKVESDTDEEDE